MMKKIELFMVILTVIFAACFSFAGCFGGSGDQSTGGSTDSAPNPTSESTSVIETGDKDA